MVSPQTELCSARPPRPGSAARRCFRQLAKRSGERGRAAGVGESLIPPWGYLGRSGRPPGQVSVCADPAWAGERMGLEREQLGMLRTLFGVRFSLDFSPSCCLWEAGSPQSGCSAQRVWVRTGGP